MSLDLFDVPCAGRCRSYSLHRRLEILRPGLPEAWRMVCLRCNTEQLLWLAHVSVPEGNVLPCGSNFRPPMRSTLVQSAVTCPPCRNSLARRLDLRLDDVDEACVICLSTRRHARSLWLDAAEEELAFRTCRTCQLHSFAGKLKHIEAPDAPRRTCCGLPMPGLRERPRQVAHSSRETDLCKRCFEVAAANTSRQLRPDWRPAQRIAEDDYGA
jgi:hypothetical protein